MRFKFGALCLLVTAGTVMHGCVSAYDTSGPPRLGLGQRAPGMAAPKRMDPPARRLIVTAPPVVPAQPLQNEDVVPIAPPPALVESAPSKVAPATAAGEQLRWLMRALSGGLNPRELRRIERRFSPEFLAQVPAEEIRTVLRHWRRDQLGGGGVRLHTTRGDGAGGSVDAVLESTEIGTFTRVRLSVDAQGRIASLWLAPESDIDPAQLNSWERVLTAIAELPGAASLTVAEVMPDGTLRGIAGVNPELRLAIGSTFKLYILGAAAELIAAGEATWGEMIAIRDDFKSLPTGQMQLEQEGLEFPLEQYAELMISISDNTAADHLLHRVGRERVEAYMARRTAPDERNTPLLSTMDMFRLKLGPDRELARRFAQSTPQEQREMLAPGGVVQQTIPSFVGAMMWRAPYEIDAIEWFASTEELSALMAELDAMSRRPGMEPLARILRINPGLSFDPQKWPRVAYKGGSEPGVINMTWLLTRADGRLFAVSISWNDAQEPVSLERLAELAGAAIGFLSEGKEPGGEIPR